ncbi:MAG: sulfite exporter TauE/SafE family protein [Burkholderiaceae bacterium]|nr:MAG: sulfite exporter TauE/SafE family protein [Burkholderiaceae bacterium]
MSILLFSLLVALGSFVAGGLGALTGLGGGVVIVPLLTVVFGVDIHYAIGASLISVIATSSGAAAAYVRDGYTNVRIGMFLEIATTCGALLGGVLVALLPTHIVSAIFGVVLIFSALSSARRHDPGAYQPAANHQSLAQRLRLTGTLPVPGKAGIAYVAHRVPLGFAVMILAGMLSSLLGIGSGAFKVLAMDNAMRLPFKVSTTTSNFMIGVTATTGVGAYLGHGYIDPALAMPVMLGVLAGSLLGAKVLVRTPSKFLRYGFMGVLLVLGVQMILAGVGITYV